MNQLEKRIEKRNSVRRLLWRWGRVESYCQARQREMTAYKETLEAACDVKPVALDGMPHGKGKPGDPTAVAAYNLDGMIDTLREQIESIADEITREVEYGRAIDAIVSELPYNQQNVIRMRYKEGWGWAYIAVKCVCSEGYTKNVEGKAIDTLSEKITVQNITK